MDGASWKNVIALVLGAIFIGPFILIGRGIKKLTQKIERKWRK